MGRDPPPHKKDVSLRGAGVDRPECQERRRSKHKSTIESVFFPDAGHPSSMERPVQNPQLAFQKQTKRWSNHRELIHRRMKERHADVPDSTHLSVMCVFARGQRKQHPQHFQWWRALMDPITSDNTITSDNIVLLHDNATSDIRLVTITRLDVVTPP